MVAVQAKLWDNLTMSCLSAMQSVGELRDCENARFSPLEFDARLCKDEDGALQLHITAAVLTRETKAGILVTKTASWPIPKAGVRCVLDYVQLD
jgi:hypothetical protein